MDNNNNKEIRKPCKHCKHCIQNGRQQMQQNQLGRKRYYCEHPDAASLKDRYGLPLNTFIGFGDMTVRSPLKLKTHKKWCPLIENSNGKNIVIQDIENQAEAALAICK